MKKYALIVTIITSLTVNSAYGQIVTLDPTTAAQSTISAQQSVVQTQQQLQSYQTQLQQLQNQIQNTTNPAKFNWDNANSTITNVLNNVNTLKTYEAQAGSMSAYLSKFENASQYSASCLGTGGCTSAQLQQMSASHYTGSDSQKIANDNMLQNINSQQQLLQNDAANLQVLQQNAQGSTGQMQAIQAASQLASNQAVQLMQIRALMISQQAAEATRAETVVDREAQAQASHDAFVGTAPVASQSYNVSSYTGTSQ